MLRHVAMAVVVVDVVEFVPFAVESSAFDWTVNFVVIRLEMHYFCKGSSLLIKNKKLLWSDDEALTMGRNVMYFSYVMQLRMRDY